MQSASDEILTISSPQAAGLIPERWSRVLSLAQELSGSLLPGLAFQVTVQGKTTGEVQFGQQSPGTNASPLRPDSIFLSASITKPIVAMAAMRLVEQGEIALAEHVSEFLPQFSDSSKRGITIRNLLTHTSGLPDMLPDNRALRMAQSPLASFVDGTCQVALDFPPGRGVQYQSMGFVLLAAIIEKVTGTTLPAFLNKEFFGPLRMRDTALGAPDKWFQPGGKAERLATVNVPEEQQGGTDWNWNSRYWLQLGAPWGGLLTTTSDLIRFGEMMLERGNAGPVRIFSDATIAAATTNQLLVYPDVPEADRRCRGWGYGWRMNWPAHSASFGDLLGPRAYGHWGATGTMFWIDPERNASAAILSTQPLDKQSGPALIKLSNAIKAAIR